MAGIRLVVDTNAIFQFQFGNFYPALSKLCKDAELMLLVPEVVRQEILSKAAREAKYKAALLRTQRAFELGTLVVLTEMWVGQQFARGGELFEKYSRMGEELSEYFGSGEAYVHAAALTFEGMYVCGNDRDAIRIMEVRGIKYKEPCLGAFDLIVAAHDFGVLPVSDGQEALKALKSAGDAVPRHFSNRKFSDGCDDHDRSKITRLGLQPKAGPTQLELGR